MNYQKYLWPFVVIDENLCEQKDLWITAAGGEVRNGDLCRARHIRSNTADAPCFVRLRSDFGRTTLGLESDQSRRGYDGNPMPKRGIVL